MLIVLNGYPGVGKLTIAREVTSLVGGRLLDNHSVYNVAFALTEFKSPAFYEAVRRVQKIADDLILDLPIDTPIILTEALTLGGDWVDECWRRVQRLATTRGPLFVIHVICELDENKRRIRSEDRLDKRKPRDPLFAQKNHDKAEPLAGGDTQNCLRLDVTSLSKHEAAEAIVAWVSQKHA